MLTTADLIINDTTIAAASCMFDTGALQASFIRRSVVDNNPQIRDRLRSCDVQVTLGDGSDSSSISVTNYVQLQIRCTDTSSISHTTPPIWLLVMPELAEDVIIGLPHLVRHLPDCFVSHIMAAVKDPIPDMQQQPASAHYTPDTRRFGSPASTNYQPPSHLSHRLEQPASPSYH